MTTLRPFYAEDLFDFNNVNLDALTETYNMPFYLQYMVKSMEYFQTMEAPSGAVMGYIMGKVEGNGENWHGHVTALTVAPEYRRLGLARRLMKNLEDISEHMHNSYFVDLYVRKSNSLAINMYTTLGYSVYREVIGYYSGIDGENAYDMRKALARDTEKKSIIPLLKPVHPYEIE